MAQTRFELSPEVAALGIKCNCFVVTDLAIAQTDEAFEAWRLDQCRRLRTRYEVEGVQADPVLAEFRALHQMVGRPGRKYTASPERLIELLLTRERFPSINVAVDAYNCVSLATRLSLGAHDLDRVEGDITLRLTDATESFLPLGRDRPERISAGEYCYVDGSNAVLCRLECRQAEKTKVSGASRNCLFIVQGNGATSQEYVDRAAGQLTELIATYCAGQAVQVWPL